MLRVKSISELKQGDKIVKIDNSGDYTILEFLCVHPHNKKYSLFLNSNKDGIPKFWNDKIKTEEWYHYSGNENDFNKVIKIRMEKMQNQIEFFKTLMKTPITKPNVQIDSYVNYIVNQNN